METTGTEPSVPQANILIVEDEEGPREALKVILSPYFNLFTVDRAEIAHQILKTHPIDLVTLDLKLPDLSGNDLLSQIRKDGKDVDVIIITGYGTLQSAIEAIRHGVAAYILKPFNVSELLDTINKTLERRRRYSSLQAALQAFGNLWASGIDVESALANIQTLLAAKHPELGQHGSRVNFYAALLIEHLQLTPEEQAAIQLGAYLHDIGKIGLHDHLIAGMHPPTEQDQELLKCHPTIGGKMMKGLPFHPCVEQIIRHHHEKYDGSGYPEGLIGEHIPLSARIVGLANIFDHFVTGYGPQTAMPVPEAREKIRQEAGKSVDPKLADLFAKVVW
ncbi:HD domain-containing phosphohydrolase [Candidatus Nitrospira neomarina]|uniref:Response regulator n=1 Tax=Candidatus Nitrospira neomarina TaxID=3020899 RepID=A0AA96GJ17_9BACT|nr:HD domain-containing phosphohydrolase [Candidatus Nitrospira neomarina]WNM63339.1 response regulator [Candidatus Nitrospira neomarina]